MAGATNRALKAAGIPKRAQAEIRLKAGGRLTLKSALDVAAKHGIDVPPKAHDFAALRDRKAALKTAKARRAEKLTRAIDGASRIALQNRRNVANERRNASAPVDSAAKRGNNAGMGTKSKKGLSPSQHLAMDAIRDGRGAAVSLATLKALRARGLVTFATQRHQRRFGRTTDSVSVSVSLTDKGKAEPRMSEQEHAAARLDRANERVANEAKRNRVARSHVTAWRKKSTGKRVL